MSWFTALDVKELQSVSEGLLLERSDLLRSDGSAYVEIATDVASRVFPPGVMKAELRSLVPHLRGTALGAIEVKASDATTRSIVAKDRLKVTTQGNRLFEVIAPLTARTIEIRRKLLVREIHLPERLLYLALRPVGHDGASSTEPLPELVMVIPHPYITDKPVETVDESDQVARLKQLEVEEIARAFLSGSNIDRLLYCLVIPSDVTVSPEQARDKDFPRFRFNGSPSIKSYQWASDFCWSVGLVEER